jgi:hypothetical protein
VLLVAACSLTSPDKVHIGRWIGTSTFETDGVSTITGEAALEIARRKIIEFSFERGSNHQFAPGIELTDPVAAGFVPSMVRLDAEDGSSTTTSSRAEDSWVFEFGPRGSGVVIVVDGDRGKVSSASGT